MPGRVFQISVTLVRALILLGFSIYLYVLVGNGNINLFINPRYVVLTKFTYIVLAVMFLVQTGRLFLRSQHVCGTHEPGRPILNRTLLPFIFTLLIAFFIPNTILDANLAAGKGLDPVPRYMDNRKPPINSYAEQELITSPREDKTERPGESAAGNSSVGEKADEQGEVDVINVTDENFTAVLSSLYLFPADYNGKEIILQGFVYRQAGYATNQFALARFVVNCCAADAILGGIICEAEDAANYEDGSWLQVRGTVTMGEYEKQETPVIKVISLVPVDQPANPYVYPLY